MIRTERFHLSVIGCGNMGSALVRGLIEKKAFSPENVCVVDAERIKAEDLAARYGVTVLPVEEAAGISRLVLLAVKPKDLPILCDRISGAVSADAVIVSVAAGILISTIEGFFNCGHPVIRIMPNLAVAGGKGLAGYCASDSIGEDRLREIIEPFTRIGFFFRVPEKMMCFITAVVGSGPGYIFYFGEILQKLLVEMGIEKETSRKMVAFLFDGSAGLMSESGLDPDILKTQVSSPGGTTLAGLAVFQGREMEGIFREAVEAAEKRAEELGGK